MSQLSSFSTSSSSGGDVVGPGSSTTGNFASFADTSGKLLADSGVDATDFQPINATLTSLASVASNGILALTAANTVTPRTITGSTNISVVNGDGVSGNPTISATGLLVASNNLSDVTNASTARTNIGAGDVVGGSSSTPTELAVYSGVNGKQITTGTGILAGGNASLSGSASTTGDVNWSLSNTNAGSSAAARQSVSSAGSDSYYRSIMAGANTWSFGTRRTDSSAFYLTRAASAGGDLSSTLMMKATTAGEITKPLQPAFLAKSNGQPNVTGDGSLVNPVTFVTEIFDQNADYDTATSIFTAPVTGRYQFNVQVSLSEATSATSFAVLLNTSNRSYTYAYTVPAAASGSAQTIAFSHLCDMDAADTAQIIAQVSGITKAVDISVESYFSGFLAC